MKKELDHFFPVAEAISLLLYPHGEVVVHNLATGCIAAIFNNLSKRKVGDNSLLEELEEYTPLPDVLPLYFKTNWDGRRMKCATAILKGQNKTPIGLLCINLDLSKWEEMQRFVMDFMQGVAVEQPEALFKNDWREKINVFVSDYLKHQGTSLKALSKEKKRELVCTLHREGAFKAKNAASYVADVLELSRATIYNYLRNE